MDDSLKNAGPEGITVTDDVSRVDWERVTSWLASVYWSPGIGMEKVKRAAAGSSLVVSAFDQNGVQRGYLRVVSDRTTFAWICDVVVDPEYRGKGVGRAMVRFAQAHPDHQGLRRWILATKDAHGVYAGCGFTPLPEPERWMIYIPS